MEKLIEDHHPHLQGESADILLMWHLSKKADSDGNLTPAWAKKTSEMERQREAAGKDFVIFLCHDVFNDGTFHEAQGEFWIDMALEACKPVLKANGDQKMNEDNEYCWRIAKPPIQVFPEVISRHGPLTSAIAKLRDIILRRADQDRPLLRMIGEAVEPDPEDETEEREDAAVRGILENEEEPEPVGAGS